MSISLHSPHPTCPAFSTSNTSVVTIKNASFRENDSREIVLFQKTPAEVLGEQFLRPTLDKLCRISFQFFCYFEAPPTFLKCYAVSFSLLPIVSATPVAREADSPNPTENVKSLLKQIKETNRIFLSKKESEAQSAQLTDQLFQEILSNYRSIDWDQLDSLLQNNDSNLILKFINRNTIANMTSRCAYGLSLGIFTWLIGKNINCALVASLCGSLFENYQNNYLLYYLSITAGYLVSKRNPNRRNIHGTIDNIAREIITAPLAKIFSLSSIVAVAINTTSNTSNSSSRHPNMPNQLRDTSGNTLLHVAAQHEASDLIEMILNHQIIFPEQEIRSFNFLLNIPSWISELTPYEIDLNELDSLDLSIIHKSDKVFHKLLEENDTGHGLNLPNGMHFSSQDLAILFGRTEMLEKLLDQSDPLENPSSNPWGTPLHLAIHAEQPEILARLLQEPGMKEKLAFSQDSQGRTPIDLVTLRRDLPSLSAILADVYLHDTEFSNSLKKMFGTSPIIDPIPGRSMPPLRAFFESFPHHLLCPKQLPDWTSSNLETLGKRICTPNQANWDIQKYLQSIFFQMDPLTASESPQKFTHIQQISQYFYPERFKMLNWIRFFSLTLTVTGVQKLLLSTTKYYPPIMVMPAVFSASILSSDCAFMFPAFLAALAISANNSFDHGSLLATSSVAMSIALYMKHFSFTGITTAALTTEILTSYLIGRVFSVRGEQPLKPTDSSQPNKPKDIISPPPNRKRSVPRQTIGRISKVKVKNVSPGAPFCPLTTPASSPNSPQKSKPKAPSPSTNTNTPVSSPETDKNPNLEKQQSTKQRKTKKDQVRHSPIPPLYSMAKAIASRMISNRNFTWLITSPAVAYYLGPPIGSASSIYQIIQAHQPLVPKASTSVPATPQPPIHEDPSTRITFAKYLHEKGIKLADSAKNKEELEEALEYLSKALTEKIEILGQHHHDVAIAVYDVGDTLVKLRRNEEALTFLFLALDLKTKILGENHHDVASTLYDVGVTLEKLGMHQEAIWYEQQALKIFQTQLGKSHPKIVEVLTKIGKTFAEIRKYKEALEYQKQALELSKKIAKGKYLEVANNLHNLGLTFGDLGKHKEAFRHHLLALKLFKKELGEQHLDVARSKNSLGETFMQLGRCEEGAKYQKEALLVRLRLAPEKSFSPYQVLGLKDNASLDDVKKTYSQFTQKHYPDQSLKGNLYFYLSYKQEFEKIAAAYEAILKEFSESKKGIK